MQSYVHLKGAKHRTLNRPSDCALLTDQFEFISRVSVWSLCQENIGVVTFFSARHLCLVSIRPTIKEFSSYQLVVVVDGLKVRVRTPTR